MSIVIGIDVGISTTKIVGIDEQGIVMSPFRIKATDPITSLYGAFGKYLHDNKGIIPEIMNKLACKNSLIKSILI